MNNLYSPIRKLHLYLGLLISPFILIFSISVLVFNHGALLQKLNPVKTLPETRTILDKIPRDSTDLATAKALIKMLGIEGEIDFISRDSDRLTFPVNTPGLKTMIELNTITKNVVITRQDEGLLRGLAYLHIMPGQHNAKIRGNSVYIKIWRQMADTVVYLLLFLTTTGIFLWYFLEYERKAGFYSIILGVLIFTGILVLIF